eukprot:COSAG02_NODE_6622_length_3453_cov_7.921586_2_plen_161_part_00
MGDAPARRHSAAQRDERTPKATPMGPRLPTLVVAEARSYPPNRGLPGMEPEQPNYPPKETASAAGPPTPARRRSYPRTSPPPPPLPNCKNPELQGLALPTSSAGPPFPTSIMPSPAPRRGFCKMRARSFARGDPSPRAPCSRIPSHIDPTIHRIPTLVFE